MVKASERLRELMADQLREGRWPRFPEQDIVLNALPLIADVAAKAEAVVTNGQLVCDEEIELERSLIALAEALNGD